MKMIRFSVILFVIFIFSFFLVRDTFAETGQTSFDRQLCQRHGNVKECEWSLSFSAPSYPLQAWQAYVNSYSAEGFGSDGSIRVDLCLNDGFGRMWTGSCWMLNDFVIDDTDGRKYEVVDTFRSIGNDYNEAYRKGILHVRVNDAEVWNDMTLYGRKVSIDSFDASPSSAGIGNTITVRWETDESDPIGVTLSWDGAAGDGSEDVNIDGTKSFTAQAAGTANFKITACGPTGFGYACFERPDSVLVEAEPGPVQSPEPGDFTLSTAACQGNPANPYVDLSWTQSANAANYKIFRRVWSTGTWNEIGNTAGLSFRDSGAISESDNYYYIRAENSAGTKDSNAILAPCQPEPSSPPSSPPSPSPSFSPSPSPPASCTGEVCVSKPACSDTPYGATISWNINENNQNIKLADGSAVAGYFVDVSRDPNFGWFWNVPILYPEAANPKPLSRTALTDFSCSPNNYCNSNAIPSGEIKELSPAKTYYARVWHGGGHGHDHHYSLPFNVPACTVSPPPLTACNGGVDVGLRLYQNGVRKVAVEPGSPASRLRLYKDGIRGVVLVDPSDPNASKMRIQTPDGIKAFCLLP